MLNKILKVIFVLFCVAMLAYLLLPGFVFPPPPPGSLQSQEPADTETTLRRAYFTDYTRAQVLAWYTSEFKKSSFLGIELPEILLNYPPEDAGTIIRDQTRSTFLQEIVHPFRESIYINGFAPSQPKDVIFINGRTWGEKITVRFVSSSIWLRLGVFIATASLIIILYNAWYTSLTDKNNEK
jgi:hypothetical protein